MNLPFKISEQNHEDSFLQLLSTQKDGVKQIRNLENTKGLTVNLRGEGGESK